MTSKNKAATVLYRAAQKAARQIDAAFGGLNVRMPLDTNAWQTAAHEWSSTTQGLQALWSSLHLPHSGLAFQPLVPQSTSRHLLTHSESSVRNKRIAVLQSIDWRQYRNCYLTFQRQVPQP